MGTPTNVRSSIMDPLLNFKFLVSWEIDGSLTVVAGVSKIGALSRSTEIADYREGGAPQGVRKIPGQTSYDEITVERGVILDVAFEQWANKVWYYQNSGALGNEVSLADFRKTLKVDLCNQAGQIMTTYYVFNAWPSKFTILPELDASSGNTVALESMTLQNEGWARDPSVNGAEYPSFAEPAAPVIAGVTPPG